MKKRILLLLMLLGISLVSVSCLTTFESVMTGINSGLSSSGYGSSYSSGSGSSSSSSSSSSYSSGSSSSSSSSSTKYHNINVKYTLVGVTTEIGYPSTYGPSCSEAKSTIREGVAITGAQIHSITCTRCY